MKRKCPAFFKVWVQQWTNFHLNFFEKPWDVQFRTLRMHNCWTVTYGIVTRKVPESFLIWLFTWCNGASKNIVKVKIWFCYSHKQILSNTLRVIFFYLKIICILHPRDYAKLIGHILKNKQKNMYVCIHEIVRLIIIKVKMIMKFRSHRYDINRLRSRHEYKCRKYKCVSVWWWFYVLSNT